MVLIMPSNIPPVIFSEIAEHMSDYVNRIADQYMVKHERTMPIMIGTTRYAIFLEFASETYSFHCQSPTDDNYYRIVMEPQSEFVQYYLQQFVDEFCNALQKFNYITTTGGYNHALR